MLEKSIHTQLCQKYTKTLPKARVSLARQILREEGKAGQTFSSRGTAVSARRIAQKHVFPADFSSHNLAPPLCQLPAERGLAIENPEAAASAA
ncbi:hypothetical protein KM043_005544 [Ampulex compressa]|nr:hypothetical protein KM043_005544 [Ampulex compressa]